MNFTKRDTPAMAETGDDVICLAEDRMGRLWVGLYTGLLSLEDGRFRTHTPQLPERFVLCVEPAADGTLWLVVLRSDPPDRGPCRLLRYEPASGRTVLRHFHATT
ncbi:MAG: hypothetical protein FJ387_26355 [Verrucomicrobia bacterium]|nr:hypothetical protein [Verrucomicrobiota bacterium]